MSNYIKNNSTNWLFDNNGQVAGYIDPLGKEVLIPAMGPNGFGGAIDLVKKFGLDPTGLTPMTTQLTNALQSLGGEPCYLYGNLLIDDVISLSNLDVRMHGSGKIINSKHGGIYASNSPQLVGSVSSYTNTIYPAGSAAYSAKTGQVVLASTPTNISVGSKVLLISNDVYDFDVPVNNVFKRGEMFIIADWDGLTTITLHKKIESTYTLATCSLYVLPERVFQWGDDIKFINPNYLTDSSFDNVACIHLLGYTDVDIKFKGEKQCNTGVQLVSCYGPRVDLNIRSFANRHAISGYAYGVALTAMTCEADVYLNAAEGVRHAFTTGCESGGNVIYRGMQIGNRVTGTVRSSDAACIDTHEGALDTIFDNVRMLRTHGNIHASGSNNTQAIYDRGYGTKILSPIMDGSVTGIYIHGPNFNYSSADIGFNRDTIITDVNSQPKDESGSAGGMIAVGSKPCYGGASGWARTHWRLRLKNCTFTDEIIAPEDNTIPWYFEGETTQYFSGESPNEFRTGGNNYMSISSFTREQLKNADNSASTTSNFYGIWLGQSSSNLGSTLTIGRYKVRADAYGQITVDDRSLIRHASGSGNSTLNIGEVIFEPYDSTPAYPIQLVGTTVGTTGTLTVNYLARDRATDWPQTVTFNASTMALDYNKGRRMTITLTANVTALALPTNFPEGGSIDLTLIQNSTGGWAIAWNSGYNFITAWVDATALEANKTCNLTITKRNGVVFVTGNGSTAAATWRS